MKRTRIEVKDEDIDVTQYRDGSEYNFTCPNCKREIFIADFEGGKRCKCGIKYKLRRTFKAVGHAQ